MLKKINNLVVLIVKQIVKQKYMKTNKTTVILASVGALGGLYYAFKKGKGFWGYAGFFVLGSIAGHLAGNVVTAVIPQPKSNGDKASNETVTDEETSNAGGTGMMPCRGTGCADSCRAMGGTYNSSTGMCDGIAKRPTSNN